MIRPPNIVSTEALPWEPDGAEPPYGSRCREVHERLRLVDIGLHLEELDPGRLSCPLHAHRFEEEHFYVLHGELEVLERTAEGERRTFALRAGELVSYPAGSGLAHRFANRSDAPARFLAISDRHRGDVCTYPDSGKVMLRARRAIGVWHPRDRTPAPREAEPVVALAIDARPAHVQGGVEAAHGSGERRFFGAPLSRPGGARGVFVNRDRLPPGHHPSPMHVHAFEEELLLLLDGELDLRQRDADGETLTRLHPGDLVHWAPGGPAHRVDNPGGRDAVYLVLGTDRPWDVVDFVERGDLYVAALGEVGTLEPRDYWDGER